MLHQQDRLIKSYSFAKKLFEIGFTLNEVSEYCDRMQGRTNLYYATKQRQTPKKGYDESLTLSNIQISIL